MKPAGSSLVTFLNATTAVPFVAHLFAITPRGGATVYLTSHSADITVGGHTWLAGGGSTTRPLLRYDGREQRAGLDPGSLRFSMLTDGSASVVWGSLRLQLAALEGVFDGAWVRVERIFGQALDTPDISLGTLPIHEGPIAGRRVGSFGVEFTVSDGREDLVRPFPRRIVQPGCNWKFGSAECSIPLVSHTFSYTSASGSTVTRINSSSFTSSADDYFALGTITFTGNVTAALAGVTRGIAVHDSTGFVDVDRPLPVAPANGDTFSITAGCPKTLAACGHNGVAGKFGVINSANYGGFPFVPTPDTVSE